MEKVVPTIVLLLLLSGFIGYTDPSSTSTSVAPAWPPKNAQDLVLLLKGVDPICSDTLHSNISFGSFKLWQLLLGSLPQLVLHGDATFWLHDALKSLLNITGTQGDLKDLLLWGISHNLSWGFLDLPLIVPLSEKSYVLSISLKANLSTFLLTCSERLLPVLNIVCRSVPDSISSSLQSLCLQLAPANQTVQKESQVCRNIFSQLSDLTDPCSSRTVRTARSITANCNYSTWSSSEPSPSDVSTCSESDKQLFISSICSSQLLLNQLILHPGNNWLQGFCAYNTKPESLCNYMSWNGNAVADVSVTYCWLTDQDSFILYLCDNPDLLYQLKDNPSNQWLNPVCPTTPSTTSPIEDFCDYDQWQLEAMDYSSISLCAWNDKDAFVNHICQSLIFLEQLLSYDFSTWLVELCSNITSSVPEMNCDYSLWLEGNANQQSALTVAPSTVTNCSLGDKDQFLMSVCRNATLLRTLTQDTNNSWVLQFCSEHLCNYSAWNSTVSDSKIVNFCWQFDQKELELYICGNQSIIPQIMVGTSFNLSCNVNNTNSNLCSYSFSNLTDVKSSTLGVCAVQDAVNFKQFVCGNSTLVSQLSSVTENSWLPVYCQGNIFHPLSNCTGSITNLLLSSCQNCNQTGQDKIVSSICSNQSLIQVLETLWNTSFLNKFIVWNLCNYASWVSMVPPTFLVSYCWTFDNITFSELLCNNTDSRVLWAANICSTPESPISENMSAQCLSKNDKEMLQWNCTNLSSVCLGDGLTVLSVMPLSICFIENLGVTLPIANLTERYEQSVDTIMVLLLLLEDMQILSLSGSKMVRDKVWYTVLDYMSQEFNNDQKRELLLKFMNTLMVLSGEHSISESSILIEESFHLSLLDLKAVISSLQPESAKRFLNILSHNWTSLQISEDYFSMIVSTILTVQVTSAPLLCDLAPFLHYLEPDELIGLLPALQNDKEVLQALGLYAGSLSEDQRFALGFWLRQSTIFLNMSQLDDLFVQKVGNLLPLLSLDVFKLLTSQQVVNILPVLPDDLTPPYQRIVVSRVLQVPNITVQDVDLMGLCVCQAEVQDLDRFHQNSDIVLALKRNLFQCVKHGDLIPDSQMLDFLVGDLYLQDPTSLSWQSISNLSAVMPALSYDFLQALRLDQLLPALPEIGLARLSPVQSQTLVQKISANQISEMELSHMGSLVVGFSPMVLQQLSASHLGQLLPALTTNSRSLSNAQTLAIIKTLWSSWNVTQILQAMGPFLASVPLHLLRTRSKDLLSGLNNVTGVRFSQQQAILLFRETAQEIQSGVRSSGKSVSGNYCDLLRNFLEDDILQSTLQLYDVINALPRELIYCALDRINTLPSALLNRLSTRNLVEMKPSVVSLLPGKSCRILLKALKAEPWFMTELPDLRRFALLDALMQCLSSAGTTSTLQQFVASDALTPFLKNSSFLSLSRTIIKESVERVTNYCYPQETRLLLAQLLEEPQEFGPSKIWTSPLLERLDRLVPLLPVSTLESLNTAVLSKQWLAQILSEERAWRTSHLGYACQQAESAKESLDSMQRQRTLLTRTYLLRLQIKGSVSPPSCSILRNSIVSAWSVNLLLGMEQAEFMDCLEEIGQDPNIPENELALLLRRVLEIAGPISGLSSLILIRLGRLSTQFSEQQLREISLNDWHVIEAFGKKQEWTMGKLKILASGFMKSHSLTGQDLDSLNLVTLGHVVCGLPEEDLGQIKPSEFCTAVLYLGQLALHCTEQQLHILKQLCATSDVFGTVSEWTRDVFQEIGSVAAGLDDMELSALVLEQIQGLTPLAISLMQPKKFAVSFSAQQLQTFSWSQAKAVTDKQRKLLDTEQRNALTLALIQGGENPASRGVGKSHANHCSLCLLLRICHLILVLHNYYLL